MTIKRENLDNLKELLNKLERQLVEHEEIVNIELLDCWHNPDYKEFRGYYLITIKSYPHDKNAFNYTIELLISSKYEEEE